MPMEFHPIDRNATAAANAASAGSIDGSGAAGQVAWWLDADTLSGDNNFKWDNGAKTLNVVDPNLTTSAVTQFCKGDGPPAAGFGTAVVQITETLNSFDLLQGYVGANLAGLAVVFDLTYDSTTNKNGIINLYGNGPRNVSLTASSSGTSWIGRNSNTQKLGINEHAPSYELDVAGSIRATKAIGAGFVSQASSATPAFNASLGNVFKMTLTANVTSSSVTNPITGQVIRLILLQDGTGSRTMTWPTNFKLAGGAFTLTTTASKADSITVAYDGTNWWETARTVNL